MRSMLLTGPIVLLSLGAAGAYGQLTSNVLNAGQVPDDRRLTDVRTLNSYHPWTPYESVEKWEARSKTLRTQLQVAAGLWPMPPRTPLEAVIHGRIDRGEYTVEKVYFASYPGHYVTGSLYRPKGRTGRGPAVLSPHGHFAEGRFNDAGEAAGRKEIEAGAAKTLPAARYPLQARCAQLARLGCVVFHYDMVGYADSQQIKHREGFTDVQAALRLQSFLGLQSYNSVRALDFLAGLPDVDPERIAVTGASGGGTQTFMLCAVDTRPAAWFPAVMVSTGMQGGCICENASLLRVGTGNIEIAALAAPRPLGMTAADDWTKEIETKGGPELHKHYALLGVPDRLTIRPFLQFGHNYNQVSREAMYAFMNRHLKLGHKPPIQEQPFKPISREQLSVFDDQHRLPADAVDAAGLRAHMTRIAEKQIRELQPTDRDRLAALRSVVGPALQAITVTNLPTLAEVQNIYAGPAGRGDGFSLHKMVLTRNGGGDHLPAVGIVPWNFRRKVIVIIDPAGKAALLPDGKPTPEVSRILATGTAVLAPDVFMTGEYLQDGKRPEWVKVDPRYAGYTFGYNRTLLANRVHDILTTLAFSTQFAEAGDIHLVGRGQAGPWVILAKAIAGDLVGRTVADLNGFDFSKVDSTSHDMFLPGAVKYGGMSTFLALCAPGELYLHGKTPASLDRVRAAYLPSGSPDALKHDPQGADSESILTWLLR